MDIPNYIEKLLNDAAPCPSCGSKPLIEENKWLKKFVVRCRSCKYMYFSAIIIDAAYQRWQRAAKLQTQAQKIWESNELIRGKILSGEIGKLPDPRNS